MQSADVVDVWRFRLADASQIPNLRYGRVQLCATVASVTANLWMRALVKLVASWVRVPPVELDGSRPKRGIRDEAVKPNHKRDAERNCRVVTKVNLIE